MSHQSTGYKRKNRETAPTENLKILCNKSTNEEGTLQKGRNRWESCIWEREFLKVSHKQLNWTMGKGLEQTFLQRRHPRVQIHPGHHVHSTVRCHAKVPQEGRNETWWGCGELELLVQCEMGQSVWKAKARINTGSSNSASGKYAQTEDRPQGEGSLG